MVIIRFFTAIFYIHSILTKVLLLSLIIDVFFIICENKENVLIKTKTNVVIVLIFFLLRFV